MELEAEWKDFSSGEIDENGYSHNEHYASDKTFDNNRVKTYLSPPLSTELKISTKSKIMYLNQKFHLESLFWKLKIIDYDEESDGIIKKQMKFNFLNPQEVVIFNSNILNESCVNVTILNQIDNPTGHVCFKDVRKVDVGISKNDVLKPKKVSKSAFYNCFVIIFRKLYQGSFREFHIKLFNSGKVEIPGIQNDNMLETALNFLIKVIQPHCKDHLEEIRDKRELVLVNSNFNCQYYLNREILLDILKKKYKIKCNMDSCSYPGIQCKYQFSQTHEVSFMIFRTGSVLIVGKCSDEQLREIYSFLVILFKEEYNNIREEQSELEIAEKLKSTNKIKKRKGLTIYI
jgi:TATA-box binding protein (TBP) (component of TFIID and TFIIIB)|tara:strand:- start:321 stop:1355 length:1035 start_codon:yes stop_codon:yes gene_type:complete